VFHSHLTCSRRHRATPMDRQAGVRANMHRWPFILSFWIMSYLRLSLLSASAAAYPCYNLASRIAHGSAICELD
jgi:hypothetical protein